MRSLQYRKTCASLAATVLTVALVAGCSTGTPKDPECPEGFDETFRPELHGLSLLEATHLVEKDQGELRVLFNNGESLAGTDDYREDRVNVALDHNIVICALPG